MFAGVIKVPIGGAIRVPSHTSHIASVRKLAQCGQLAALLCLGFIGGEDLRTVSPPA